MSQPPTPIERVALVSSSLCYVCDAIFKGTRSEGWHQHHETAEDIAAASSQCCYICRTITNSRFWSSFDLLPSFVKIRWRLRDYTGFSLLSILADDPDHVWNFELVEKRDSKRSTDFYTPPTPIAGDDNLPALASNWLESCMTKHDNCGPFDPGFRPMRLIQILDEVRVKLILPSEEPSGPYVAFSHCWGGVEALKLRSSDVSRFRGGLTVNELPESYQEAISVCIGMNIHFIWIYSLCIIQDSPHDYKREALAIEQVYKNSLLNLCAATGSNSSHRSFSARERYLFKPLEVTSSWENQDPRGLVLSFSGMFAEDVLQSPLRTRAWVYQEFFLSGRSLILARGQMWWHCRQEVACEGHPSGYSHAGDTGGWVTGLKSGGPKSSRRSDEVFQRFSAHRWKCLVQDYVQMRLSKETDRVFAFSAVVRSFGKSESMEDQYLAGLWRRDLPRGLFWGVDGGSITHRVDGYRAPSWSWVSLEGPFAMPATVSHEELIASLENVWPHYNDHETDLMTLSKGAGIEICGHLIGPRNVGATGKPSYLDAAIIQPFCGARQNSSEPWHEVTWDEHDAPGKTVISYADKLNLECRGMGLVEGATRETVRLEDAQGAFFFLALHIYNWTHHRLSGIVLYQPPHQAGIFHRVGIWEAVTCPDGSSIYDIGAKYAKQTVYII